MSGQKTLNVATEFGDVTVKKLALGDYAELLRALDFLPRRIAEIVQDNTIVDEVTGKNKIELTLNGLIVMLPTLSADALPELAKVVAACTNKDAEFMLKLDLADFVDIIEAASELNDYERIFSAIKKIMSRRVILPQAAVDQSN